MISAKNTVVLILVIAAFIIGFSLRAPKEYDDSVLQAKLKAGRDSIIVLQKSIDARDKIILDGLDLIEERDSLYQLERKRRTIAEYEIQRERKMRAEGLAKISSDSLRALILERYKEI